MFMDWAKLCWKRCWEREDLATAKDSQFWTLIFPPKTWPTGLYSVTKKRNENVAAIEGVSFGQLNALLTSSE